MALPAVRPERFTHIVSIYGRARNVKPTGPPELEKGA